jgi:peptidoglycan hydrolase-like protein with peptidoglycan-binding domain
MKSRLLIAPVLALGLLVPTASVFASSLTGDQVNSILGMIAAFGGDQSMLASVQASLTGTASTGTGTSGTPSTISTCTFTRTLVVGNSGSDVSCLQQGLKNSGDFTGKVTGYYGPLTAKGVSAFQRRHSFTLVTGVFGVKSRKAFATDPLVSDSTSASDTSIDAQLDALNAAIQSSNNEISQPDVTSDDSGTDDPQP